MESEKVKEIKKALEFCVSLKKRCRDCDYNEIGCYKLLKDSLTYINELENLCNKTYIAETQSKNTCDILKQRTKNNRKTIKIVGPCSKWVEGEGWVTEVPIKLIGEKVEEVARESKQIDGFNDTFWLLLLAFIFSNNQNNCKYNDNGHCDIQKGNGDFNECQRVCEYFEEDK